MKNINLPIKTLTYPAPGDGQLLCPVCGQHPVGEPHSFVAVNGGALLRTGEDTATISDQLSGFWTIRWHGAHRDMGGQGPLPEASASVDVAHDTKCGQWDIYCCSTECLRRFFGHLVDLLEEQLEQQRAPE